MPKTIIFDIDGTLFDSVDQHASAWQEAFRHFGFAFSFADTRYQIGKGGDKLLAEFLTEEQIHHSGKQIEQYRSDLFKTTYSAQCKPFPSVRPLFERLKSEGHALAIASSGKKDEIQRTQRILGIDGIPEVVITGDDVENSKPDPDILHIVREKFANSDSEHFILVGDSPHDAEAAQKGRIEMVGVLCGGFPEDDLRRAGTSAIYNDPEDLLKRWYPD